MKIADTRRFFKQLSYLIRYLRLNGAIAGNITF